MWSVVGQVDAEQAGPVALEEILGSSPSSAPPSVGHTCAVLTTPRREATAVWGVVGQVDAGQVGHVAAPPFRILISCLFTPPYNARPLTRTQPLRAG